MRHLGDISKVHGGEIEPVDIITFGSHCQDLSVAGKRAGLKHEANGDEETTRSGLFMEAVRIIKEMRAATNGMYPTFALWENVPGAFSSNGGEDFRIVCEELIKIVEPSAVMPEVPAKGWAYADSYVGDGWSLAYRVFDAQYWGVPQRRRRIHLVADFRGACAREILFEREGLRGYFAQSGETRQGTPADAERSTGADDREGSDNCLNPWDYQSKRIFTTDGIFPTLQSRERSGQNQQAVVVPFVRINGETAGTLDASYYKGCGMRQGIEREVVAIPIHDQATRFAGKRGDKSDGKGNGLGVGQEGDPMNTLTGGDRHAVAFAMQAIGQYKESNKASSLKARDYKDATDIVCGVECRNGTEYPELNGTLQAKSGGGTSLNYNQIVRIRYIVRRLTPTECARLQGFADQWGNIEKKDNLTDEEYRFWLEVRNTHAAINGKKVQEYTKHQMLTWYNKLHTDSAEYKMWGNGIALPPALYVMQGIANALYHALVRANLPEHCTEEGVV